MKQLLQLDNYNEQELILLVQQKSRHAFNCLYSRYSGALYGVINRIVADEHTSEDVLQEVFVKVWQRIDQYDACKSKIYTWLHNIARNAAIDTLRSKGQIMKSKLHHSEEPMLHHMSMRTEQVVNTIGLSKMVGKLKTDYQAVVYMAYYKGYTLSEIADALQIPLGTVKTRIRSAIGLLRKDFAAC